MVEFFVFIGGAVLGLIAWFLAACFVSLFFFGDDNAFDMATFVVAVAIVPAGSGALALFMV